jgi:hypothetical protein
VDTDENDIIIKKGTDINNDSYSAFEDNGGKDTGCDATLRQKQIQALIMCGLASDYCVGFSMKHGLERGYDVHFLLNLSRGVTRDTTITKLQELQKLAQDRKQIFTVNYLTDANDGMTEEEVQTFEKAGVKIHRSKADAFLQKFAPRPAAQSVRTLTPLPQKIAPRPAAQSTPLPVIKK